MKEKLRTIASGPVMWALLVSVFLNVYLGFYHEKTLLDGRNIETRAKYPLLSPRIFAESQNDILVNFLSLRRQLRELTSEYGSDFGFYFEYLPSGTSIGVNEKEEFYAASLIKVPVVMAYFRQKEATGFSLDRSNIRLEERDIDVNFGALGRRGVGTVITYEEASRLALVESDNTATVALANRISQEYFDDVYEGLDIDFKKKNGRVTISTKQYASILKALYFSSILSKESSNQILSLLTKTNFNDTLPAGVPVGIPVAHKFGVIEEESIHQDCGIVYVPQRPYVLCMMSKSSEGVARERMIAVSKAVYAYVSSVNK